MLRSFGILLLVIFFIMFSGCSNNNGASAVNEPWYNGRPLSPAKLTFLIPAKEHERFAAVKDQIEKKAKDKLNVELQFIFTDSSYVFYQDLLELKLSSSGDIDMFITYDSYLGNLVNNNMVADITVLFPKYAPTYSSMFSKEQLAPAVYDGRLMAVPQCRLPEMRRVYAVVRDDLLEKYKITKIENFDDYEKFLEKIKKNERNILPLLTYNTSLSLFAEYYGYVIFDYSFGLVYKWDDPDMKLIAWEQTPEYKEAINTLYRWKKNGYINDGITNQPVYLETEVTGGGYASFLRPYGTARYYNELLEKEGRVTWRYREFDLYPNRKSQRIISSGPMIAFNRNSPDVKRALMFLEWIQTDQKAYDTIMYGIKGQDYVTDKKSRPVLPENFEEEYSYSSWSGKNIFYNYNNERIDSLELKRYMNTINEKSDIPPHLGFHIDHQALYKLIGSLDIQRNTFYLEHLIDKGIFKKEDIDNYIKSQRGITRFILNEMQRQLDVWKNKNKK